MQMRGHYKMLKERMEFITKLLESAKLLEIFDDLEIQRLAVQPAEVLIPVLLQLKEEIRRIYLFHP